MRSLCSVDMASPLRDHWDIQAFEEVLACNIKDVIAEFCLTDADIIRFYADNRLHGNMDDIMMSSAELFFKGETLSYGYAANAGTDQSDSAIVFDMEFVHGAVTVFFQLIFGNRDIGVTIDRIILDDDLDGSEFDPSAFARILSSARLRPLPLRFMSSYCLGETVRH